MTMTDEQINDALAAIAKPHAEELYGEGYYMSDTGIFCLLGGRVTHSARWRPLHDWSQLGPLMEWFRVPVGWHYAGEDNPVFYAGDTRETSADLKRAIALALIAAHGGDAE